MLDEEDGPTSEAADFFAEALIAEPAGLFEGLIAEPPAGFAEAAVVEAPTGLDCGLGGLRERGRGLVGATTTLSASRGLAIVLARPGDRSARGGLDGAV